MSNTVTVEDGGTQLLAGRYRVDGLLGRGGMSEVYFGYDERLDRRVAIKVLRTPGPLSGVVPDSPEAAEIQDARDRDRRRFLREIRVTARLEHPGTPAVYDTGVETSPGGAAQVWLVMQLLRGSTLEALLDHADFSASAYESGTAPSVAWAAAIAAQIAAVLADVHRVDVVHRDIKPANVMITEGGLVKVLDFGIAILRGASALPRLPAVRAADRGPAVLRHRVDATAGTPPADRSPVGTCPAARDTRGGGRAGRVDARQGTRRAAERRVRLRHAAAVCPGFSCGGSWAPAGPGPDLAAAQAAARRACPSGQGRERSGSADRRGNEAAARERRGLDGRAASRRGHQPARRRGRAGTRRGLPHRAPSRAGGGAVLRRRVHLGGRPL